MNQPGAISSSSLKKQNKFLHFFKKSHPKQTSYTFLKNSMDLPETIPRSSLKNLKKTTLKKILIFFSKNLTLTKLLIIS